MRKSILAVALTVAAVSANVSAEELSYDYAEAGFASMNLENDVNDVTYQGLAAKYSKKTELAVVSAELYSLEEEDNGFAFDEWRFGVSYPVSVGMVDVIPSVKYITSEGDDGMEWGVGARYMVVSGVEVNASYSMTEMGEVGTEDNSSSKFEVGAVFNLTPDSALTATYQVSDYDLGDVEGSAFMLGYRVNL